MRRWPSANPGQDSNLPASSLWISQSSELREINSVIQAPLPVYVVMAACAD
jgi:hypothetical protein